jgi:hypothetical protein
MFRIPGRVLTPAYQIAIVATFAGLLSLASGSPSRSSQPKNAKVFTPSLLGNRLGEIPTPDQRTAAFFQSSPMAPDLNIGTDWLNTKKPLSLADLQGHVVLLDFWTLC